MPDLTHVDGDIIIGPRSTSAQHVARPATRLTRDEVLDLVKFAGQLWPADVIDAAYAGALDEPCPCCGERLALHADEPTPAPGASNGC